MENIYRQVIELSKQYEAKKVVLFGSRARGDNHERSDIDLAIYGMPNENRAVFWSDIDDLPTLLKFDLVHIDNYLDSVFLKNIEKNGVTLYERL